MMKRTTGCIVAISGGIAISLLVAELSGLWRPISSVRQMLATDKDRTIQAVDTRSQPLNSVRDSTVDIIPIALSSSNNISLEAVVNRKHRVTLMFHLAEDSVVLTSAATANIESLQWEQGGEIKSWGGTSSAQWSKGNRLEIGTQIREGIDIFVDEFSGPGTDGKVGPHFFSQPVLELDLDRSVLVLHSELPSFATSPSTRFQRIDIAKRRGGMYIQSRLSVGSSTYDHELMLHTGFSGTVILDDAFVSSHPALSELETISTRELRDSFGNIIKTRKVELPQLEFGGQTFINLPVEYFEGDVKIQETSIVGCELLFRHDLLVDKEHRHLYIKPRSL